MKGLMKGLFDGLPIFERMENDRIAKRMYVEECIGSRRRGGLIP